MAKKVKDEIITREVDPNAWMVTFSDLLTLLLTFFVLLLTMSSMDRKKIEQAFGELMRDPGVIDATGSAVIDTPRIVPVTGNPSAGLGDSEITSDSEAYRELLRLLDAVAGEDMVRIEIEDGEILVRFRSALAFEPNSDILTSEARHVLESLSPLLARLAFPMAIEGHSAAARPRSAGDPHAQMSLSLRRAHSVLRLLTQEAEVRVPDGRLTLTGRGAQVPMDFDEDGMPLSPSNPIQQRVEILIQTRLRV